MERIKVKVWNVEWVAVGEVAPLRGADCEGFPTVRLKAHGYAVCCHSVATHYFPLSGETVATGDVWDSSRAYTVYAVSGLIPFMLFMLFLG